MLESFARLRSVPAATALATAVPAACAADGATAAVGWGPWLFATVALVLVAAASFAAGAWRSRRESKPSAPPSTLPVADAQALPSGSPTALPAWAEVLAEDPRPVVLLAPAGASGPPCLRLANACALRRLGLQAGDLGRPWHDVARSVPGALREMLSSPPTAPILVEGWWLLHDAAGGCTLALGSDDAGRAEDNASLTYTIAHDLRAPIRVVDGFARIVKEDYGSGLDRMANDHLDRVLAAAARMNQMIDAMLKMAQLSSQPLVRQRVDLTQLATFVVDDLKRASPLRQAQIDIEPDLIAHGDPTLLRLVLENLLGNAWKYSERCELAHVEFRCVDDHGQRSFVVRDNGAGFDMRTADRLFGLFQRLHSAKDFPGTGLGLASVKRIVQRHGGQVWADAAPGKGASFHFTLRE